MYPTLLGLASWMIIAAPGALGAEIGLATTDQASDRMICHTSNPDECYPAVFVATKEFRVVHEDQAIPRGLHVRMNLATGVNEARLDIPEADDVAHAEVMVLDPPAEETVSDAAAKEPKLPARPGMVVQDSDARYNEFLKNAVQKASNQDTQSSSAASEDSQMTTLSKQLVEIDPISDAERFIATADSLTEFVNDVEWGVTMAEDSKLIEHVWQTCTMASSFVESVEPCSSVAVLIGTALQNNAPAQKAFLQTTQRAELDIIKDIQTVMDQVLHSLFTTTKGDNFTHIATRLIFLVSQLCQDLTQRALFATSKFGSILDKIDEKISSFSSKTKWEVKLQRKITNFDSDYGIVRNSTR